MNSASRKANIELYRILCMFLIVTGHFIQYGYFRNELPSFEDITIEIIVLTECMQFARTACSMFALITGYFLIQSEYRLRKLLLMLTKMELYSIVLCFAFKSIGTYPVTGYNIVKSFFPVIWGNWYAKAYVCFYPFTPYLNKGIMTLSQKEHKRLIYIFLIIWSLLPTFGYLGVIIPELAFTGDWNYRFGWFSFLFIMYIIGAYIRLYGVKDFYRNKYYYLMIGIISALIMILMVYVNIVLGIKLQNNTFIRSSRYFSEYTMLPSILMSTSLFVFFTKIDIRRCSKIINVIASTTFGIYLIHIDNIAKHTIHISIYNHLLRINNVYLRVCIGVLSVFAISSLTDLFYNITVQKGIEFIIRKHKFHSAEKF